jgi:hypothetical protein
MTHEILQILCLISTLKNKEALDVFQSILNLLACAVSTTLAVIATLAIFAAMAVLRATGTAFLR